MNVNEIRDRILEVSHDEVAPDTDLELKALRWLNSAYHEIMDECMPYFFDALQTEESIAATGGVATLGEMPQRILSVIDTQTGRVLKEKTRREILQQDPAQSENGAPYAFWKNGKTITAYPALDTTLSVLYVPMVSDLLEGGEESTIKLAPPFHHGLVWGGLVWSSIYERGFSSQSDILLFQKKWEESKRKTKLSLSANPSAEHRVQPFELIS